MTNPSAKSASRGGGYDRTVTLGAASREAGRTGHPEVGFEHLLLGVLVNGGPGARLLMAAGVSLTEARSAIDEILREDLALLGIDAPLPAPSSATGAESSAWLPLTPRLRELTDDCPQSGGDRALLAALIDDEGGRVRRLLDRLGVDTDRVRRDLDEPAAIPEAAAPSPVDGDPDRTSGREPEGWESAAYDLDVAVSPERLWDLVSDPERREEWESSAVSSRQLGGGAVELTTEDGTTARDAIVHRVPGREITWEQEPQGDAPHRRLRIVIEPLGEHARLYLHMSWPTALRGRLGNRIVRWFMRQNLRVRAQVIAQAAAS
ncbi:Clp protease N-terminal domain-containing protein [Marinactinospora rubrisoli]|uniref:Clp protease N-terminal domain-containing protein n=1 Tax=Marinactinospora rubrisoli TaxID=2715399 RepID=A0ABW2KGQ5_9ACTN